MEIKDYITLFISLIALGVSSYTFYIHQFRRKECLIGSMISIGINNGKWDRKIEYSVSNVGDVQLIVKEVEFIIDDRIINSKVVGLPIVLKQGEMTLFDILYNSNEIKNSSSEIVEIGIFSALGKGYRLPHIHKQKGEEVENRWKIFKLHANHEGF